MSEIAVVTTLASIIAANFGGEVDAYATAVLLITRQGLDALCEEYIE
jgi:hypothetical protein